MKWFGSGKIAIDLGTANSLVFVPGKGVVLNEPSVVAVSLVDNRVLAVGHEAEAMLGRTPGNIRASKPMKDGVIADFAVTEAMLKFFIKKVGLSSIFGPEVLICAPAGVTQVERRAVLAAARAAGASKAYLLSEPLAAAVGAGIAIDEPSGNMVLDMGGGTAEAAIISLGGIVASGSVRVAGNKIDEAIARYIRRKHNLVIGEATAERIKIKIGNAVVLNENKKLEITGRDSVSGLPRQIEIGSDEVTEIIKEPLSQIASMVKRVLEEVPPELSSDIIDKGIAMSGGTATLSGLDRFLVRETGVPVFVAEEPLLCVVRGAGEVVCNLEKFKTSLDT
jgi:rod shape-determining protein MreB and related proteins